jgi:hypothetical protein
MEARPLQLTLEGPDGKPMKIVDEIPRHEAFIDAQTRLPIEVVAGGERVRVEHIRPVGKVVLPPEARLAIERREREKAILSKMVK